MYGHKEPQSFFKKIKNSLWRFGRFLMRHTLQLIVLGASFFLLSAGVLTLWVASLALPDYDAFEARLVTQSTKIFDRSGKVLLFDAHKDIRRSVVASEEISRNIKNAAVAIEDANFYQHRGIEPQAMLRAFFANIDAGRLSQGGSTITQQVIKNSLLTQQKKLSRKIKEIVLALKMERVLTKEHILTLYLNESPYGGNLYGVEEASLAFFGKRASDVTLAEAAYIAALPNAPTYFSPYGNHREALEQRKDLVLRRMRELGFITADEEAAALAEKVQFAPIDNRSIKAPHFVMYVKGYLEEKYGKEAVENSGLKVVTTLDWAMQQKAEAAAGRFGPEIEGRFNAKNMGLVGSDPKTGQVLLMVGSRDYFDIERDGNFNVTIAHRQPGSTFKPFVYATAFAKGYTPETVVFDLATQFNTHCSADGQPLGASDPSVCYMPENYDEQYRGPISLRNALAQSVNIPAIKVLYLAGIKESILTARRMGIRGLKDPGRYGLTLVLGGGEVSLLDLTEAYGVFANDGIRNPETIILRVEDSAGNILEEWRPTPERVLAENISRAVTNILLDNEARAPAFGANSALYIEEREVAVKTGTTNNYRDVWILGYTPSLSLGVWAGNNDNSPIEKKVAGFVVAPIWNSLMRELLPGLPVENFSYRKPQTTDLKPILRGVWQGGDEYVIDKATGSLATENTPEAYRERRVIPAVHSILYWVDKKNPLGVKLSDPATDPQFSLWEIPVRAWALSKGYTDGSATLIPASEDSVRTPDKRPIVHFENPRPESVYQPADRILVSLRSESRYPLKLATFFFNNIYMGTSVSADAATFSFVPQEIGVNIDANILKVIVEDSVGNKTEAQIELHLNIL